MKLIEKVEVLRSGLHGVDQELVAAVETKHDEFKQAASCVKPEAELACGTVFVQFGEKHCMLGGMQGIVGIDAVLTCRVMNLHAT